MKKNQTFQRGSGCYKCACCGRLTRETGNGESDCQCCYECYTIGGIVNMISDGCYDNPEHKARLIAEVRELEAKVAEKGGRVHAEKFN